MAAVLTFHTGKAVAQIAAIPGKEASTINMYIYQSSTPPSSPVRKGDEGGVCICRIMNM